MADDGAANFDAAVQKAFEGTGVTVKTSFTPSEPLTIDALNEALDVITRTSLREVLGDRLIESQAVVAGESYVMVDPPVDFTKPGGWDAMTKVERGYWILKNVPSSKLVISTEGRYGG